MRSSSSLPFLPGGRALRRYRSELFGRLAAEPAAHLLAGLFSLPLGAEPLPEPAAILAQQAPIALLSPPASGRTLALLQVVSRWAETGGDAAVLYLPLSEVDAPNLSPRAVVASAAHKAGLSPALAEGDRPGILLIDDWELLPADRRALWSQLLVNAAPRWSALRAVAALPQGGQWPGLHVVSLSPPDKARAEAWLRHLLPGHDCDPIIAALHHGPLASARTSLADLSLLALTYPHRGLPPSRARLYEQAYMMVRPLLNDEGSPGGAERPGQRPTPGAASTPVMIGRALLRHYRLARALAGGNDLETLTSLSADERAAVAPLAAGLLDDPTPVLAPLWAAIDDPANLRALVACARETPSRTPLLGLSLVEHLCAPRTPPEARPLLLDLAPALPPLLAAAGLADEPRAVSVLHAAVAALPPLPDIWLELCDSRRAPAGLRWAAAAVVAAWPPAPALLIAPPADALPQDLAPRAYVAALAGPESRAALAHEPLRGALTALLADPHLGEQRAAVAGALLDDPQVPEALRALALGSAGGFDLLELAAGDTSPALRHAALATLLEGSPATALVSLTRALARPGAAPSAQREILDTIAGLSHPGALTAAARASLDRGLSLAVRLHAVDLLAGQGSGGTLILRRILVTTTLPVALRATAAGHLGRLGVGEALPALASTLVGSGEPLLRRVAAIALGALGQRPALRGAAARALLAGLRRAAADAALGERIVRALGNTGDPLALRALAGLLSPTLGETLRAAWLRVDSALERTPAFAWPTLDLPEHGRLALLDALADGSTLADPPSRLAELASRQATRLAIAAAEGLADLAESPALYMEALAALRRAAYCEGRAEVARATLAALARVGDPATELGAILSNPGSGPSLRWLAVESLGATAEALELLRRRIERHADEPFVQAMIVEALGLGGYAPALPALRRIAHGADSDPHLRRVAITALGHLAEPDARGALVGLAADPGAPAELRAAAAAALPAHLTADERIALHQALRAERLPPDLAAALARALARAGDLEALPALVRSAQSDPGAEAIASIEALARMGSQSTAPLLVRISQSPLAAPSVRLAAVAALLRLGGDEYLPLLREYLAAPSPPLRIQAHAALAATHPHDPRLGAPLADPGAPLAMRLQALEHLAAHSPDAPEIAAVVAAPDEQPQVRLAAAAVLAAAHSPAAVASLCTALIAGDPDADPVPPVLRRRCAVALGTLARSGGPAGELARARLADIAADPDQAPEQRHWATEALLGC